MKILYLHQYFNTNKNSGGTRSFEFAKELNEKGHQVVVITGKELDNNVIKGTDIKLLSTRTKYFNKMSFFRRIIAFFHYIIYTLILASKVKNVDVVYATSTPITIGVPGYIISKVKKAKFLFEVRDVWPDIPIELGIINNKILIYTLKKYEKFIYNSADYIIILSRGMKKNLLNKGISENKLSVITNLANLGLFNKIDESKEIVNNKYGLKDKFVCIHPGTMGYVNGLEFILQVAKITIEIEADIHYLLIGDGKEKSKLKEIVENNKLNNVTIANPLPKSEIVHAIEGSDIGLMVVRNEFKILEDNSANKFFDFLAAGLPTIINYGGWQKKELEENNAGISAITPKEMANSIIKLKNNIQLKKAMETNAKQLAHKFSKKNACLELHDIIENKL